MRTYRDHTKICFGLFNMKHNYSFLCIYLLCVGQSRFFHGSSNCLGPLNCSYSRAGTVLKLTQRSMKVNKDRSQFIVAKSTKTYSM